MNTVLSQKQFEHALTLLQSFYFPETVEASKGSHRRIRPARLLIGVLR